MIRISGRQNERRARRARCIACFSAAVGQATALVMALLLVSGCKPGDGPSVIFEDAPRPLNAHPARDPQLIVRASGTIAVLAVEPASAGGENLRLHTSPSRGDVFVAGPQVNLVEGSVRSHGEGAPILLASPRGKFYAIWLGARSDGKRGTALRFARSDDFLRSFGAPVVLDSGPGSGPAFFDATVAPDGSVIVAFLGEANDPTLPGSSHVLVSSSADEGRSFTPPVSAAADVCPCCRPGLAADAQGRWYLAWRNMDEDDVRDLVVAVSGDRGAAWSSAMTMPGPSWRIDGCPHSGPSMTVMNEELFVAWYTEATGQSRLFWSQSRDGGRTFSPATDVAQPILDPNHPRFAQVDGRLFVVFQGRDPVEKGSWGPARPFVRAVGAGEDTAPVAVPTGKGSASYPVMSGLGAGRLVVAWTDSSDSGSRILAARGRTTSGFPGGRPLP